ncbi:Alpha-ketoglutarate-dependent dioxygenase alkB 4 [Araneus ventricosus]|uniref:Alpha-ketoglutarate-dependent dioxygenase alkB 4 n=1 Tax=Araneus ventricosus TaxID=182803 RepID=A0A4Y2IXE4_ARAVE|nr:Alpha-ketoglutarate-dependent dioxygenase alkB 4 [Araneus ventricosus]
MNEAEAKNRLTPKRSTGIRVEEKNRQSIPLPRAIARFVYYLAITIGDHPDVPYTPRIRACLLCEKDKSVEENVESDQYSYCHYCNLCWPITTASTKCRSPLYLGGLKLLPDFISIEEEKSLIASIDQIPWMPSQSGRRKQDFGPKVNFKKKKAKLGDFKGLPHFTKNIVERLQQYEDLSDFKPVELCHLDYSPDRGSAIDPHLDDFWIWGERLVTINLASSTVLTLSPANLENCKCTVECRKVFTDQKISKENIKQNEEPICEHKLPAFDTCLHLDSKHSVDITSKVIDSQDLIRDMCSVYRRNSNEALVEIQVELPPRSLFILAGCSRCNWLHGIKRQAITSRRLAMTFRELAEDFLDGGNEKKLGDELLELGRTFYNPLTFS